MSGELPTLSGLRYSDKELLLLVSHPVAFCSSFLASADPLLLPPFHMHETVCSGVDLRNRRLFTCR